MWRTRGHRWQDELDVCAPKYCPYISNGHSDSHSAKYSEWDPSETNLETVIWTTVAPSTFIRYSGRRRLGSFPPVLD